MIVAWCPSQNIGGPLKRMELGPASSPLTTPTSMPASPPPCCPKQEMAAAPFTAVLMAAWRPNWKTGGPRKRKEKGPAFSPLTTPTSMPAHLSLLCSRLGRNAAQLTNVPMALWDQSLNIGGPRTSKENGPASSPPSTRMIMPAPCSL